MRGHGRDALLAGAAPRTAAVLGRSHEPLGAEKRSRRRVRRTHQGSARRANRRAIARLLVPALGEDSLDTGDLGCEALLLPMPRLPYFLNGIRQHPRFPLFQPVALA